MGCGRRPAYADKAAVLSVLVLVSGLRYGARHRSLRVFLHPYPVQLVLSAAPRCARQFLSCILSDGRRLCCTLQRCLVNQAGVLLVFVRYTTATDFCTTFTTLDNFTFQSDLSVATPCYTNTLSWHLRPSLFLFSGLHRCTYYSQHSIHIHCVTTRAFFERANKTSNCEQAYSRSKADGRLRNSDLSSFLKAPSLPLSAPTKGLLSPQNIVNLDFQKPLGEASAVAQMAQPNAEPLEDYE